MLWKSPGSIFGDPRYFRMRETRVQLRFSLVVVLSDSRFPVGSVPCAEDPSHRMR